MRHIVRAVILKDKHMLLVTGHKLRYYWTPGGAIEQGESVIEALHREVNEELGTTVKSFAPYFAFRSGVQNVESFLVDLDGDIKVGNEITGYIWYSSRSGVDVSNALTKKLLPKLRQDGLIQ